MKNIILISVIILVAIPSIASAQTVDTLDYSIEHGRRFLKRKWLRERIEVKIQKGDTLIHEIRYWYAYRRVSPNTLQIWKTESKKYIDKKLVYKMKKKWEYLLFRKPKEYYTHIWELDNQGKLKQIK